jgi:hypothetical protein
LKRGSTPIQASHSVTKATMCKILEEVK